MPTRGPPVVAQSGGFGDFQQSPETIVVVGTQDVLDQIEKNSGRLHGYDSGYLCGELNVQAEFQRGLSSNHDGVAVGGELEPRRRIRTVVVILGFLGEFRWFV